MFLFRAVIHPALPVRSFPPAVSHPESTKPGQGLLRAPLPPPAPGSEEGQTENLDLNPDKLSPAPKQNTRGTE